MYLGPGVKTLAIPYCHQLSCRACRGATNAFPQSPTRRNSTWFSHAVVSIDTRHHEKVWINRPESWRHGPRPSHWIPQSKQRTWQQWQYWAQISKDGPFWRGTSASSPAGFRAGSLAIMPFKRWVLPTCPLLWSCRPHKCEYALVQDALRTKQQRNYQQPLLACPRTSASFSACEPTGSGWTSKWWWQSRACNWPAVEPTDRLLRILDTWFYEILAIVFSLACFASIISWIIKKSPSRWWPHVAGGFDTRRYTPDWATHYNMQIPHYPRTGCLHGDRNGMPLLRVGVYPVVRRHKLRLRFVDNNTAAMMAIICCLTCHLHGLWSAESKGSIYWAFAIGIQVILKFIAQQVGYPVNYQVHIIDFCLLQFYRATTQSIDAYHWKGMFVGLLD